MSIILPSYPIIEADWSRNVQETYRTAMAWPYEKSLALPFSSDNEVIDAWVIASKRLGLGTLSAVMHIPEGFAKSLTYFSQEMGRGELLRALRGLVLDPVLQLGIGVQTLYGDYKQNQTIDWFLAGEVLAALALYTVGMGRGLRPRPPHVTPYPQASFSSAIALRHPLALSGRARSASLAHLVYAPILSSGENGNGNAMSAEDIDLLQRAKTGDRVALDAWIGQYERLVQSEFRHLCNRYSAFPWMTDLLRDDLLQAGRWGLWKAIRDYDFSRGVHFATYARSKIRGNMHTHAFKQESKWQRSHTERLEAPFGPESDSSIGDTFESPLLTPEEALLGALGDQRIRDAFKRLSPAERQVLILREGLHGKKGMGFQRIGREIGMSEGQAELLYERALTAFRAFYRETLSTQDKTHLLRHTRSP